MTVPKSNLFGNNAQPLLSAQVDDVEIFFLAPEDAQTSGASYFEEKFATFDVANANCYDPVQCDRLLGIIEAGFGGLSEFNAALKTTMDALQRKATAGRGEGRTRGRSFTGFM